MSSSDEARTGDFKAQPTKEEHLRLVAALGAEFRRVSGPRDSRALRVRLVERLPAPALCDFKSESLYFKEKHFSGVSPLEVGTDLWYLQHIAVIGAGWHEWAHYHFSPRHWEQFVQNASGGDDSLAQVAVHLEESRCERRMLAYVRTNHSGGYHFMQMLPDVMQKSMWNFVVQDIKTSKGDTLGWRGLSSLTALVQCRVWAGTLDKNEPDVKRVLEAIEPLLSKVAPPRRKRNGRPMPSTSTICDELRLTWENFVSIGADRLETHPAVPTLIKRWQELMLAAVDGEPEPEKPDEPGKDEESGGGGGGSGDDKPADGSDDDKSDEGDESDGKGDGSDDEGSDDDKSDGSDDKSDGSDDDKSDGSDDDKGDGKGTGDEGNGSPLDNIQRELERISKQDADEIDRSPSSAPASVAEYLQENRKTLIDLKAQRLKQKASARAAWR